jgi:CBS domain-containing protein
MFAVTGPNGEVFRGSLEHLLTTHRVPAMRQVLGVAQEGNEVAPAAPPEPDEKHYRAAAAAYGATLKPAPERGPIYHAYQVMSRDVVTLTPGADVERAWRALVERRVGQAPVVSPQGAVIGLVSRAHLLHVLNEEHGRLRDVMQRRVADVMETPVVTVDPVADVRRIARVMLAYDLPALPVVDEATHALVGIVSRADILRVVATDPPLTLWA